MVFVILAENETAMTPVVEEAFGTKRRLKFGTDQWFVSMPGTVDDVWDRLDLGDDQADEYTSVIIPVTTYSGWADPGMWDWIASRLKR